MSHPRLPFRPLLLVLLFAAPVGLRLHAQAKPLREVIDAAVRDTWEKEKITPAKPASDAEFLRRIYLDLVGVVPTYEETVAFLDSKDAGQARHTHRQAARRPAFAQHQADVWDMILFGRQPPGYDTDKREGFQAWLRGRFEKNVPYDAWARELLEGGREQRENGALYYVAVSRRPRGRHRGDQPDVPRRATPVCPLPRSPLRELEATRLLRHGRVPRPAGSGQRRQEGQPDRLRHRRTDTGDIQFTGPGQGRACPARRASR